MPLKPLGLKDPLLPPQTLGQTFSPLQALSPLGQSKTALGHLQAAEFLSPLVQMNLDSIFDDGTGSPSPSSSFSDLTSASDVATVADTKIRTKSEKPIKPELNSASSPVATDNIVFLKPLGFSKPLSQESNFLTPNIFPSATLLESVPSQSALTQPQLESTAVETGWETQAAQSVVQLSDETPLTQKQTTPASQSTQPQLESIPVDIASETQPAQSIVQSSLQSSQLSISPEQIEQFSEDSEAIIPSNTSLTSESRLPEISPSSASTAIQSRLDNQISIPQPLDQLSPLAQESDFQVSKQIAEFSPTSSTSQETPILSEHSIVQRSQLPAENILTPAEPPAPNSENIPNSWSSISELLNATSSNTIENRPTLNPLGFTQPLNRENNLIQTNLDLGLQTKDKEPTATTDNQPYSPTSQIPNQQFLGDLPNSWSSISELLEENYTDINRLPEDEFAPFSSSERETSSIQLYSPFATSSSISEERSTTSEQIVTEVVSKDKSADEGELEILAQTVYTLLKRRLEIDGERWGNKSVGYPMWLSNDISPYGTSTKLASNKVSSGIDAGKDNSDVSILDNKLEILTQEVYILIQQRLEIEQERQGHYQHGLVRGCWR
ncbi:hypothetical protein NUACC21_13610 [Scytonema sp. NUACC21]